MGGQLDYSQAAEWAGIAAIGRHSMAITPQNGPCQRISVVYVGIDTLKEFIVPGQDLAWVKDFCQSCGKCVRACPTGAILETPAILHGVNPTRIAYEKCCAGFLDYGRGICIKVCPFTNGDYEVMRGRSVKATLAKKGGTP